MVDESQSNEDDRLLAELAAVVGPDSVPENLAAICRELSTWADVDAELALLFDVESTPTMAGVRSTDTAESTAREFHLDDGAVVIEVEPAETNIAGTVMPVVTSEIVLETIEGSSRTSDLDALGRFSFPRDGGVVRLRLVVDGRAVVTDWFIT